MSKKVIFLKGLVDSRLVEILSMETNGEAVFVYPGNIRLDRYCTLSRDELVVIHLSGGLSPSRFQLPSPALVVNCVCDPDRMRNSLDEVDCVIDACRTQIAHQLPVINHPADIRRTTRNEIYRQFHELPGINIPKTVRILPKSAADVLSKAREHEIDFPFLTRSAGVHGGQDLTLVDRHNGADVLERFPFDGRPFYLSQYIDTKSKDGLYRKLRVFVIDGVPYARHFVITNTWMVHAKSRWDLMATDNSLCQEEDSFLRSFHQRVNPDALRSIREIHRSLKLGYFGIDCHVTPDGTLQIFEINSSMLLEQKKPEAFNYLQRYVTDIERACDTMIRSYADLVERS